MFILLNADNEHPIVTCPRVVSSMLLNSGMTESIATWSPLPSANDVVDGEILAANITCEDDAGNVVMSGDLYPLGLTKVTCRANDTALNEGSCEFYIYIHDVYRGKFLLSLSIQ